MKVLVSDPIAKAGVELLKKNGFTVVEKSKLSEDELMKEIADADAIVVRSGTKVTAKVIAAAKQLKVIGRAGAGLDNVDRDAAKQKGIEVVNTPYGNTISAAEHTVAMMLSLCRRIPHAQHSLRKGEWERSKFKGIELCGKTIGIIGLGNIGQVVAKLLSGFDVSLIAFDPFAQEEKFKELNVKKVELQELLKQADFITVHVPMNEKTKNMLSKKEFAEMKPSARVVNVARGGIIDENALYEALKSGKLAGAALDVFEKEPPVFTEILKLDNVVSTPHLGAATKEAQDRCGVQIAEKVVGILKKHS